jgi:hypothetical protein
MVRDGVCLFFENSTVCRNVSAMLFCFVCLFWFLLVISAVLACLVGWVSCSVGACCVHLMESLILAQDERWRRA